MCKENGVFTPMSKEARKARGLVIWEDGEVFRPGKTRREHANGVHAQHLKNRKERADANKRQAGTLK